MINRVSEPKQANNMPRTTPQPTATANIDNTSILAPEISNAAGQPQRQ
jgi:hypothetical protein